MVKENDRNLWFDNAVRRMVAVHAFLATAVVSGCFGQASTEVKTFDVTALVFSPNGELLASGSWDGKVKLWDIEARRPRTTLQVENQVGPVSSLAFSSHGETLATGGFKRVKLWNTDTFELQGVLSGHNDAVGSIVFLPDGCSVATASWISFRRDKSWEVKIWNIVKCENVRTLAGTTKNIKCLSFSQDGKSFASGGLCWEGENIVGPGDLKTWNLENGEEIANLSGHAAGIVEAVFSPDGKKLAAAQWTYKSRRTVSKEIGLWDLASGAFRNISPVDSFCTAPIRFSPDGKKIAITCVLSDGVKAIKILDADSGEEVRTLKPGLSTVSCLAFCTAGKSLAVGGLCDDKKSGAVTLLNVESGEIQGTLNAHPHQ